MFSQVLSSTVLVLALVSQVSAHAAIAPALGVKGAPVRNDVQRPSTATPCGTINVASTIDTSTPVVANAAGQFAVTVTDFNAGADGSRSVSGTVDATGAGSFTGKVTIVKNGNAAPTTVGSDQVTATLPAGTKCTAGASKNLCVVSFKTTAGFGNCVVVQQAAAGAAAAGTAAAGTAAAGTAAAGTAAAGTAAAGTAAAGTAAAGTAATGTAATAKAAKKGAKAAAKGAKAAAKGAKAKAAATGAAAKAGAAATAAKAKVAAVAKPCAKAAAAKAARNVGGSRAARAVLNGVIATENVE